MASLHGKLAEQYWNEIPKQFPFVELDAFVVMPNHIHGILIINKNITNLANNDLGLQITKNDKGGFAGEKNPMLHENISRIIRWYKGRCSFEIHKYDKEFSWQSNYYEHVIRNEDSFQRISEYIINNPLKWIEDKFYNENLQ
jgi:REP element-mobilizing transposase RayT